MGCIAVSMGKLFVVLKDGSAFIFWVKQCFLLDCVTLEMKVRNPLKCVASLARLQRHFPEKFFPQSLCCDDPNLHGIVFVYIMRLCVYSVILRYCVLYILNVIPGNYEFCFL